MIKCFFWGLEWNILGTIWWIAKKFGSHILDALPEDLLKQPLVFHLAPSSGEIVNKMGLW